MRRTSQSDDQGAKRSNCGRGAFPSSAFTSAVRAAAAGLSFDARITVASSLAARAALSPASAGDPFVSVRGRSTGTVGSGTAGRAFGGRGGAERG